jgi:hypothetical protein
VILTSASRSGGEVRITEAERSDPSSQAGEVPGRDYGLVVAARASAALYGRCMRTVYAGVPAAGGGDHRSRPSGRTRY